MARDWKVFAGMTALGVACLLGLAPAACAQPSADQVLTDVGMSASDKQKVLAGEFVTSDVTAVSDRDLSVALAFLVKTSPAELADKIMAADLVATDPQVRQHGMFKGKGSAADVASLTVSDKVAQTFLNASPGEGLNLSAAEIAAFGGLAGASAVQAQLQRMLRARFQAYQTSGLAGIAGYARSGGPSDVAADIRKASDAASELKKYLPAFQAVLTGYPQATVSGMRENFYWLAYDIDGTATYVLTHTMAAPEGDARVVVQRQYYVSTGYNAEQAVAGFLPVSEGTLVVYANHTFTDQVAGFGGGTKRSIGRRMMASKLKALFDQVRTNVAQ